MYHHHPPQVNSIPYHQCSINDKMKHEKNNVYISAFATQHNGYCSAYLFYIHEERNPLQCLYMCTHSIQKCVQACLFAHKIRCTLKTFLYRDFCSTTIAAFKENNQCKGWLGWSRCTTHAFQIFFFVITLYMTVGWSLLPLRCLSSHIFTRLLPCTHNIYIAFFDKTDCCCFLVE